MKKLFLSIVSLLIIVVAASAQKVFSVQYANQADVKVFVVKYENQAGWRNNSKKAEMY
ncbi:MAG: hypothetical protein WCL21_10570 [Mariniphaga sp.]